MNKKISYPLIFSLGICVLLSGCGFLRRSQPRPSAVIPEEGQTDDEILNESGAVDISAAGIIVPPRSMLVPGEKCHYKISWLGLEVADAWLEVREKVVLDGREAFHVILTASTNKVFSFFYNFQGFAESYVDAETFQPLVYNSESMIRNKFVFKKMKYDHEAKVVYAEDKKGHYELGIDNGVLDPLGVFYYFRLNEVELDRPVELLINTGKKNFNVVLQAGHKKKVRVPSGRFWAFLVQPTPHSERQFDDVLNAAGRMWVWFGADEARLPLIIILKLPFGTAQAVLYDVHAPSLRLTRAE